MNAKQIIEEIRMAYPVDVFPELTKEDIAMVVEVFPGVIDRNSAMMGRHLADIMEEKLTAVDEVDDEVLCDLCGHDIDWHGHGGDCDWQDSTYEHMCMCQKTYEQVRGDHFQRISGKLNAEIERLRSALIYIETCGNMQDFDSSEYAHDALARKVEK